METSYGVSPCRRRRVSPRQQFQLNFLDSLGFNTIVVRGMDECRQFLRAMREEVELRGV